MRTFRSLTLALCLACPAWLCSGMLAGGCADEALDGVGPGVADATSDVGGSDTRVQVIDVGDEVGSVSPLCGDERLCDPDVAAICTPIASDTGAGGASDTGAGGASDTGAGGASDTGAGGTLACRIVLRDNRSVAACAPAGTVTESNFCASDDECAPGLGCVGQSGLGRCLRYCCKEWAAPKPPGDGGAATHYCTPQPMAARPSERVPVWVKLDNCTLLADELQCAKGTTCTVVTNDGRTTCVPAGAGRDYASCAAEPCDRGYVCLGTTDRRCRKLCRDSEGSTECSGGAYCQRLPTIPSGFGICAGGDAGP
jgi:hypothetical protein